MYSWNKMEDRVAIVQMNAALRHAQLELLSAHCVTHQLRQRFSVEDLARYGQRDVPQVRRDRKIFERVLLFHPGQDPGRRRDDLHARSRSQRRQGA
jgi:hypothetical protein